MASLVHAYSLALFFYFIFPNKYLANTKIDPSAVQMSSIIILFMGAFVISNIAYSLNEFLLYFYKKYNA